ncbi:farnesyl pyrophosphate synthase-like [Ostrinia nubilalis]|uniref:farnesyl pyrophosphate synthase-like n=1 Tax=Ostrinia nubilalis TaxID=29057 RepID=UPI003082212C
METVVEDIELKRKLKNSNKNINDVSFDENEEKAKFLALFPEIVAAVLNKFASVPDIASRVKKMMEYNSAGGSKARGLMTVRAYQRLESPDKITDETMRLARILGWCVELFQTSLIILDDVSDKSTTRRGALCWFRLPDVGVLAINDSLLMLTIVFDMLKENFGDRSCYPDILYTFNETLRHLCFGQYDPPPKDFIQFTIEQFNRYSIDKRSYYTFKLPIYISLLLANKADKNVFDTVEEIFEEMGLLLSMQNDYIDCFGDEKEEGKAGTDIQEGKCTWLAVQALARGGDAARAQLEACYGRSDAASECRVRTLYEELRLPELYRDEERVMTNRILDRIKALPNDNKLPPMLILEMFQMIQDMRVD